MSIFATIATAVGSSITPLVSSAASILSTSSASSITSIHHSRLTIRNVIADTAKRRSASTVGCNNIDDIRRINRIGYTVNANKRGESRSWNGLAFASMNRHGTSCCAPSSLTARYFSSNNNNNNNNNNNTLPWTPIREAIDEDDTTTTSSTQRPHHLPYSPTSTSRLQTTKLYMTPPSAGYGTEGFRDAIRGGQGYIQPRGPEKHLNTRDTSSQIQQVKKKKKKTTKKKKLQSQKSQTIQSPQSQSQSAQQEQEIYSTMPKLTPGRERNYRPPHVISALQQTSFGTHDKYKQINFNVDVATKKNRRESVVVLSDDVDDEEDDYHADDEFDDEEYDDDDDDDDDDMDDDISGETTEEADFCGAKDLDERQHCLESFRDGRQSAGYLTTKGPPLSSSSSSSIGAKEKSAPKAKEKKSMIVDDDIINGGDTEDVNESLSEQFRDNNSRKGRSGSDVGYSMDDRDEMESRTTSELSWDDIPIAGKKKFGPDSMNFRDGTPMATYKDDAFKITSSLDKLSNDDDKELPEDENLLEEGDDLKSISEYRELLHDAELGSDSILRDAVDKEIDKIIRQRKKFEDTIHDEDDDDLLDFTASKDRIIDTLKETVAKRGSSLSSSSSTLLSIDPNSIDIIPLKKGKAEEEGMSTDRDNDEEDDDISSILKRDFSAESSPLSSTKWEDVASSGSFVKMFRGSASYIANHRSTLAVYHIPGELLAWEGFPGLMDDIALTWLLGMKIVLVAGCRHQIDLRLEEDEDEYGDDKLGGRVMMSSIRVTDEDTLRVVKEEAGFVRFEIERRLAKSLRLHGGLVKGSESLVGNVVSGNFYSAQVC